MTFMEKRVSKKTNKEKTKVVVVDSADINTSILTISLEEVVDFMAEAVDKEAIILVVVTSTSNKFTRTYLKTPM